MNSWWFALEKEISSDICDQIKQFYLDTKSQTGQHGDGQSNKDLRNSKVVGFPYGTEQNKFLHTLIHKYIVMANAECFGFDLNGLCEFQIAEYGSGGHYDNHFDMRLENRSSVRKLGITVQLSEAREYAGGDFVFSDDIGTPSQDIIKQKGTVIVFPSFIYHKVKPVTQGKRYSLVGWYEGNYWR